MKRNTDVLETNKSSAGTESTSVETTIPPIKSVRVDNDRGGSDVSNFFQPTCSVVINTTAAGTENATTKSDAAADQNTISTEVAKIEDTETSSLLSSDDGESNNLSDNALSMMQFIKYEATYPLEQLGDFVQENSNEDDAHVLETKPRKFFKFLCYQYPVDVTHLRPTFFNYFIRMYSLINRSFVSITELSSVCNLYVQNSDVYVLANTTATGGSKQYLNVRHLEFFIWKPELKSMERKARETNKPFRAYILCLPTPIKVIDSSTKSQYHIHTLSIQNPANIEVRFVSNEETGKITKFKKHDPFSEGNFELAIIRPLYAQRSLDRVYLRVAISALL